MIVPGGGLSFDGTRWVSSRSNFLVHVNVLARLFRGKMLAMLMDAHGAGQLKFFNTQAGLADKGAFKRFIAPLRHIKWVVYPTDQKRRGPRCLDRGQTCVPLSEAPSTDVVLHPLKADILAPIARARSLLNGGMASSLGLHPAARRHRHRRIVGPQTAGVDVLGGKMMVVIELDRRPRGAGRHRFLDDLLQFSTPAPGDEQPDADGGVARRHGQNRGGGEGCGYAASLGQRKRVAHIPTAEAEAARSGLILEGQGQARLHLKSNPSWSHEWGPVHITSIATSDHRGGISGYIFMRPPQVPSTRPVTRTEPAQSVPAAQ